MRKGHGILSVPGVCVEQNVKRQLLRVHAIHLHICIINRRTITKKRVAYMTVHGAARINSIITEEKLGYGEHVALWVSLSLSPSLKCKTFDCIIIYELTHV